MPEPRCALAVLPAEGGDADRLLDSLAASKAVGMGDFGEASAIFPHPGEGVIGTMRSAAEAAQAAGFDWLLAVTAAETLVPDIFVKTAPALRLHDAVWGGAGSVGPDGKLTPLHRITRLAAQDLPTFFHAAFNWWIGPSLFVRPAAMLDALHAPAMSGCYAGAMATLWRQSRAYKTAQALTAFHGPLPMLADADRQHLVDALERDPVYMPVHHDGSRFLLPFTGLNPVIEREQMRGQFFEPDELRFLSERLPRGLRTVDAGANTGNHTVFFAGVLEAEAVIPIEPDPRAVRALRDAVAANGLVNVDLSCLGTALGAGPGRLTAIHSAGGGLGATRFVADAAGAVRVAPLDALVAGPVDFLKVDVEGMEMAVLAGAAGLIARNRPRIFIEVLDTTTARFMAWVDANGYRFEKAFPDKTHCNYLVGPAESC